jgi:hypothetical protein
MAAAIAKGAHPSARVGDAAAQLRKETMEKVKQGQAQIVQWDDIKHDPPKELKISPVAMIPHKSRGYRAILDLSYSLQLAERQLPSVNETTVKTAPRGAIDQMGHVLSRIVHAFAEAGDDRKILMAKWDIKDGFWRLDCEAGQEWNFSYVLPPENPTDSVELVVPTSLQMGWIESPPYFCAASETGRDVAATYMETPIGSLPDNKFLAWAINSDDYRELPRSIATSSGFKYIVEVYMDDYIGLVIPSSQEQLQHAANAIINGIHDIFPPRSENDDDPVSFKKITKGDGTWLLQKDILGFTFDGKGKTIWLEAQKRDALLTILHQWLRASRASHAGIPFVEFESVVAKVRHAFLAIPAGKGLLSPCNRLLRKRPPFVFLHRNTPLRIALQDIRTLLRDSTILPTRCTELVMDWPDFVGITDASKHGCGGVIIGEKKRCTPTVFRLEWPDDIKNDINTHDNPGGRLTNSDLEMAGLLVLWLVMEDVCQLGPGHHVALFSDNTPTVSWVRRLASKRSLVAAQLLRALALRLKTRQVSPLTPLHIAGCENSITDIPSRSWGSEPKWLCREDSDLRVLFDSTFPLPYQSSWTVYRLSSAISMRVISALRMMDSSLDEWRRLPRIGRYTGGIGRPTAGLWEWTLTYRLPLSTTQSASSQVSLHEYEAATMVAKTKSELERSVKRSRPLARRLQWSEG